MKIIYRVDVIDNSQQKNKTLFSLMAENETVSDQLKEHWEGLGYETLIYPKDLFTTMEEFLDLYSV